MSAQDSIEVVAPRAGDPVQVLGAEIMVKSSGDPSHFFFADHPMPHGYGVPLHVHEDEDEAFFVLEGEITLMSREGDRKAGAGAYIFLPRGVAHGFVNASGAPARIGEICAAHGVRMLPPSRPSVVPPSPSLICSSGLPPVDAHWGEGI